MFQPGQQQMTVPANQIVGTFLQINVNQPPYVPQIPVPQYMAQYLPYIAGLVANEVQSQAQSNPMRTFMFNLLSQNNYYNNEFTEVVAAACDYIELGIMKRQFADVGQAAQQCVPRIVEMIAAANVRTYAGLSQFVPQQAQQAVQALINTFSATGNEIVQMKAQQQNVQAAPQQSYFPQGQPQQQRGSFPSAAPQFAHTAQPVGGVAGTGVGASLFNNTQQSNTHVRPGTGRVDRWAGTKPAIEEQTFEQNTAPLGQPFASRAPIVTPAGKSNTVPAEYQNHPLLVMGNDGSYQIPAVSSEEVWIPNPSQPYIPAYNPSLHMLFHQVFPNGTVGIIIKELTQAMMDWKQHNLNGGTFGTPAKVQKMGAVDMDKVWADVTALNHTDMQGSDAVPELGAEEVAIPVQIDQEWKLSTSIEMAILNVRMAQNAAVYKKGSEILAFESYGTILKVSADKDDHTAVLDRLSASETYVGLSEKLKAVKGEIPDNLWYMIDEAMTNAVNRVLRKNLSIAITMDRFSDDIVEVFSIIERKGTVVTKAFNENQESVISTTLSSIPKEYREAMDPQLLDGIPDIKLTYLGQDCSFTMLDCMSHDLEVELQDGLGVAVLETMVPEIYALVRGIFDRATNFEGEAKFSRHFILTNDLKVLEATQGHIGADFYLLSLVQ